MYSKLFFIAISLFAFSISGWGQKGKKFKLLSSSTVYFNSGKAIISPKFKIDLQNAAKIVQQNEDALIFIHSHTDSVGSFRSNEILAAQRAQVVYDYLESINVDTAQIDIRAYGEYIPLGDNGTVKGRAQNRRVSLQVVIPYIPKVKKKIHCTLKGLVKDAKTGTPLDARLLCIYLGGGMDTLFTDKNGTFDLELDREARVEVRVYAKGYFFVSKLADLQDSTTQELSFSLEPALLGEKMALSNLYFHSGSPALLPASDKSLEGLLAFMQYNNTLKIEIGGHINKPNRAPVAKESSSFILSESRAEAVYKYLIINGIDGERLSYKGYGNSEMLYPRASTTVQQQMNRRVELKIIE
ncbi:MAG: OmpA family protein [Aureispira sp.]|nr:OmpA family protein [Aureispira sp.]